MNAFRLLSTFFLTTILTFSCKDSGKEVSGSMNANTDTSAVVLFNYENLEKEIPGLLEKYKVPAVSVAVIEDGKVVWYSVFGMQNENTKATCETLFLTASIAKPVTAEIFLRLASQGKVLLDEPMYKHWLDPDIMNDPKAKLLTPRHVLTHQTGFKNWRYMTNDTLRFERSPGTETGYSGEGLLYLVRFIEKKFNQPFNDIAEELLFKPENMNNTSLVKQDWYEDRLASPMFHDGKWREPNPREQAIGAGGMYTTSEDYANFIISIMNEQSVSKALRSAQFSISRNQEKQCLESATVPEACPDSLGFGLGWYVYNFKDEQILAHSGANNGERTLAVFSPKIKSGLVVMTNGANGNYVIYDIAEKLGVNQKFIDIEKPSKPFSLEKVE